jgi:hypothetical protein
MKLNSSKMLLFICMFFLTVAASAQKNLDKPFQNWSKSDATKIVSDSGWAQTYQSIAGSSSALAQQIARESTQTANRGGGNPRSVERNLGPPPVVIRLHSALPVRQALIRLQQIGAGYDKMSGDKKAEFDASTKGFLECAICKNYYVVTLTQFTDASNQRVEEAIFQRFTLNDVKDNVYLINDKGEKRELVQFTPPKGAGDSAIFFFARKDAQGNQFLTPDNKEFKFVFKDDFLTSRNPYAGLIPRNFEFKVSKITVSENLEF